MDDVSGAQLSVRNLQAFYGESHALRGVDFHVDHGEVVALLGRNGAGKTTTIRSIMGMIAKRSGSIRFEGHETIGLESDRIARLGITHCPEDRGIYSSLSVRENLELPPVLRAGGLAMTEIYQLFPRLKERSASAGTKLSGGEQQMLAIARILRTGATLLLLDEPTEGLAPVIVKQIGEIIRSLKSRRLTILLVEQNLNFAAMLADRHYVVEDGAVIDELSGEEVRGGAPKLRSYLGV
jgi:branched-chain amino acid transport system ATP-binding protein